METLIHLDTHVVVWLYAGDVKRLAPARPWLEHHDLVVSPMVKLELAFLCDIGRLKQHADEVIRDLVERVGLRMASVSFSEAVERAVPCPWTRDPFDRLIVGTALAAGAPLLTADQTIHRHCPNAVWKASRRVRPTTSRR